MKPKINGKFSRHGFARVASRHLLALILFSFALPCLLSAQTLQHEWSFNEPGGSTTATDSVAGANITLLGSTSLGGGVLTLPGGGGNYAQFPNGILSTNNSITIETWLTDNAGQTWARAWSFGGQTTGPNNNFIQNNYIDLIPKSGPGPFWTEFNHNGNVDAEAGAQLPTGSEQYTVVTYDAPSQTVRLYLNGVQVATATGVTITPASLGFTYNNYLGLDQWNDAVFNGTFDEMRIWTAPVSQRYLSASTVAGPGVVINNLTPTSASLTAGPGVVITGTEQATFTVTLPQTGASLLLATSDATNWISSNPGVLAVNSSGLITGVGVGSATVSATVAGVTETSGNIVVAPQTLLHRYSFASDASDSVGGANGTLVGPNGGSPVTINNGLTLPGGGGNNNGYVSLPSGILTNTTSVTVECWATQNQGNGWATIWDFANNNNVNFGLIPFPQNNNNNMEVAVNPNNNDIYTASSVQFPNGSTPTQYVSFTFDNSTLVGNLYTNGTLIATQSYPDHTYSPGNIGGAGGTTANALGNDIYGDSQFQGTIYEFRIWNGAVSPVYLAASEVAGPSVVVTNTTPQSLAVSVTTSMIGSQTQQATVTGSFIQVANVPLTGAATNWTSSNLSVLTVNSSGLITAVNGGSATVSATVNGVTAVSAPITVSSTFPTVPVKPANQTVVVNDNASFSVQALGGSLGFQWSFNATPLTGATNATLNLTNVNFNQAGTYSVLIANNIGSTNVSAVLTVVPPILQHEWSFNESGGTTAVDSISSSNITLLGGTSLGSGVLTLPGGAGNYAQFPNGILSTYSNSITIETWFTDNGGLTWARPWSFGGSTTGPNNNFTQGNYIDLIPTAGNANGINGGMWTEFNHNGNTDAYISTPLPTGIEEYVTVTYQVWDRSARLYLNGVQVATATNINFSPSDLGFTYNNFLGLDQWNDPIFNGTFDEMRIWDGAVTPLYEMLSAAAGPGVIITNTTPQSVSITVNTSQVVGQTQQATASADFIQVSSVPITALATNWISSNPSVVTVSGNGVVTAIAHGTAAISATFSGITGTSSTITVSPSIPVITQEPVALLTLLVGGTLQASVASIGDTPFTYYWFTNSGPTPVSVSSSPVLTMPNLQLGNAGSYVCVVSNQVGTATSSALNLTVVAPTTYQQVMLSLNPIGYWPLNETSGTTAYDVIGGHNGTYTGTYVIGQTGPTNVFFGDSVSALFDGTSGHVDISDAPFNITNAITVLAWVNVFSGPTFDGLFGHGDTSWRLSINPSGQPGGNDGPGLPDATDPISSPGVYDSNWHMVAYTYTGIPGQSDNGGLYVDGVLVANNTITNAPVGNDLDVWIGGSPDYDNRFLPAYIANASVFNQVLSPAQIQGIYNGVAVSGPPTITITHSGSNVVLNWQTGSLLEATNVLGPWKTNNAAVSGYTVPATNAAKYFRLLVTP